VQYKQFDEWIMGSPVILLPFITQNLPNLEDLANLPLTLRVVAR